MDTRPQHIAILGAVVLTTVLLVVSLPCRILPSWLARTHVIGDGALSIHPPSGEGELSAVNTVSPSYNRSVFLDIWTQNGTRNATAPYLPGILFEDIAHSGDGGIYAELLRNRAFQGSGVRTGSGQAMALPGIVITSSENPIMPFGPVLDGWYGIGDAKISLDFLHPLSGSLQVALQIDVPTTATGIVGFKNDGWWGIPVSPQTYNASFHVQANGFRWNATLSHFNVSLQDNSTSDVFVSSTIRLNSSTAPVPWMYQEYATQLHNNVTAVGIQNAFAVTMDASEARGQTFYFSLMSLFPETFKNRPNGLRRDLASALEAGGFKFLRFPGGNNLEGYSIARRWKWWETIGPLKDRPGRPGDWSYYNTDGLGLLEYMYWCEDAGMVPVLGIYAGFSLDIADFDSSNSTDTNELPISMMGPVLQEALDELEFLTGAIDTYWGAKRAEYGHPEPFEVPFVELGNEDSFSHNYPARAEFLLHGLKAKYPDITYIYSAAGLWPENPPFDINLPQDVLWDEHIYAPASSFMDGFDYWDNWQARTNNTGVFGSIMEYHVGAVDQRIHDPIWPGAPTGVSHPRMLSAVAEAIYALGWERNPDIVKLQCFAPAIQNRNVYRNTPYLILFDADPTNTLLSASYHQEALFAAYPGTHSIPLTIRDGVYNPLFWHAAIDVDKQEIYLKVINAGNSSQILQVAVDVAWSRINGTTLHAHPDPRDLHAVNSLEHPNAIVPRPMEGLETVQIDEQKVVRWLVPPYSVNVIQLTLEERQRAEMVTPAPGGQKVQLAGFRNVKDDTQSVL